MNKSRQKPTPAQQELRDYINQLKGELGEVFDNGEGIECTGEPSVDPSRTVHPNQGDSEWMDDW